MVLVCSRRRYSLRRASNLYQARGGPHRRRLGRIRCRSDGRIVDLSLPRVSLGGEPLESAIQCARNFLFRSHRHLRGRGHNCLFSSLSKRRAALRCSGHFSSRRGNHGHRGYFVFPGSPIVAAVTWYHARNRRIVFVAEMNPLSGRKTPHYATSKH